MYKYVCRQCVWQVRDEATKAGRPPTRESVWSYFIQKSASNLHIVLCMSPIGEILKTRCRNFPGLVNNTSIDWFTAWPKQALQAVAGQFLAEVRETGGQEKSTNNVYTGTCICSVLKLTRYICDHYFFALL